MDWHVEVIRFERICHFPKSTEGIVPGCLFKAKCFLWLTALLREKKEIKKDKKKIKKAILFINTYIHLYFI